MYSTCKCAHVKWFVAREMNKTHNICPFSTARCKAVCLLLFCIQIILCISVSCNVCIHVVHVYKHGLLSVPTCKMLVRATPSKWTVVGLNSTWGSFFLWKIPALHGRVVLCYFVFLLCYVALPYFLSILCVIKSCTCTCTCIYLVWCLVSLLV